MDEDALKVLCCCRIQLLVPQHVPSTTEQPPDVSVDSGLVTTSSTRRDKALHYHLQTALNEPGYGRERLTSIPVLALSVSCRVQPGVYTTMALSRCRDVLVRHKPNASFIIYPPLLPVVLTSNLEVLLLRHARSRPVVAHHVIAMMLQLRHHSLDIC